MRPAPMARKIGCTNFVEAPTPVSATSFALFAAAPHAHAITTAVPPSTEWVGVRAIAMGVPRGVPIRSVM